jgi:hypothetical protein
MNDVCPKCGKRMPVRTSKRVGESQQQYLKCKCGGERTKVVPASEVWRRPGRVA